MAMVLPRCRVGMLIATCAPVQMIARLWAGISRSLPLPTPPSPRSS